MSEKPNGSGRVIGWLTLAFVVVFAAAIARQAGLIPDVSLPFVPDRAVSADVAPESQEQSQ